MRILDIRVPQMGEGLREVLILKLVKKAGEFVRRDEVIYVMESDKALVEVESPYEGILKEWLVDEAQRGACWCTDCANRVCIGNRRGHILR